MCGILGFLGNCAQEPRRLALSWQSIHHRGPDSHGDVTLEVAGTRLWFGHVRLAILDLSVAGHQPMQSQDGRWWLTYNGEIFNHLDIRRKLDVQWRGHSDTETLVEAIAAWGIEATLPLLNGMFAFGAIDTSAGKLYLARDHFGIKPLYYIAKRGDVEFGFASEVRALAAVNGVAADVDAAGLQTFMSLRYVPSPHTLFKGVSRLQPGHLLTYSIEQQSAVVAAWVVPTPERFSGSIADAVGAYEHIFRTAVRRQLLADVPVGLLLSGGIDSAMLAAFSAEQGICLPCYTVGYGNGHNECEISDAEETARVLGLPFHSVLVTAESTWVAFVSGGCAVEEPLGTTSILPMWDLIKRARQDVTVVLTGQGSDESWGGYRRYQGEIWRGIVPFPGAVKALQPLINVWKGMPEYLSRAIQSIPIPDQAARFEAAYALFTDNERCHLLGNIDTGYSLDSIRYWLNWAGGAGGKSAGSMMAIDARMGLADDLLLYADKISMAHSLEARVPMLDVELVRFVESLPLNYRVSLNNTKIVHKIAAERLLPSRIVHRKKKGFQVPFGTWIRNIWKERVETLLLDSHGRHLDLVSREAIEQIWHEHQRGNRDRGRQLFALASLALWCNKWL